MCIDIEVTSHDYIEFQVTFSNTVHGQDHMQQQLSPAPLPPPPPPPAFPPVQPAEMQQVVWWGGKKDCMGMLIL
jgi:hypothetical protein